MNNYNEKLADLFVKDIVDKIKRQEQMVKNEEYISWLYEFTKVNPRFTEQQWLYNTEGISSEDYDKVMMLSDFFVGIEMYHTNNLLMANENNSSTFYNIKYKDMYIVIGLAVGQGGLCFAERLDKQPEQYTLYENIMNDVEDETYRLKKEKLEMLVRMVEELKDMDVDYQVVKANIANVYNKSIYS